jgi:hypothetical protein
MNRLVASLATASSSVRLTAGARAGLHQGAARLLGASLFGRPTGVGEWALDRTRTSRVQRVVSSDRDI